MQAKTLIILSPSQLTTPYNLQASIKSFANSMASTLYGTYYASYSLALAYVTSVYAYDQYAPESMGGSL